MKIAHLTSPHSRYDTRIFSKECSSLAKKGYDVSLIVADGIADEIKNSIKIFGVKKRAGRFNRIKNSSKDIFRKACQIDADIYHLHDPELIPIGLKLKCLGKIVIFDSHEDVSKQILGKPYLSEPVRWLLAKMYGTYEARACKRFDAIIAATPFIQNKFLSINRNTLNINNFPIIGELGAVESDRNCKKNHVCYVGSIGTTRGIKELVQAMEFVKYETRLHLAGRFYEVDVEKEVKGYAGWDSVDEAGWLDRTGVCRILNHSIAGLVTLHPLVNYIDALPVKMFEYMSAGLPVIASNFPLWKEIVEGNDCGICVDPLDPEAIGEAIQWVINHPKKAEQMGENGREAVEVKFNWEQENKKLLELYEQVLSR